MSDQEVNATILIVDDEKLVRNCGADILTDAGFEVLEAGNAADALAALDTHHEVRLLFSDLDMPGGMGGLELARLVHERWPDIGLLLTSAYQTDEARRHSGSGDVVISKPWTPSRLVQNVRELLSAVRPCRV